LIFVGKPSELTLNHSYILQKMKQVKYKFDSSAVWYYNPYMITQEDIQNIVDATESKLAARFDNIDQRLASNDRRFDKIEERFDNIDKQLVNVDQRFDILAKELFTTRDEVQVLNEKMLKGFSDLQLSVDAYAKRADSYFQEMVMLSHKVDRHERWLLALAEKMDVKLEY